MVEAMVGEGLLVVHTPTHVRLTYKGALEAERLLFPEVEEVPDEVTVYPEPAAAPALRPGKPRVVFLKPSERSSGAGECD